MSLWLVFIVALLGALAGNQALTFRQSATEYQWYRTVAMADRSAAGLAQYMKTTGLTPTSLQSLATVPGYEWLRSALPGQDGGLLPTGSRPLLYWEVANNLNDGIWRFSRTVLFNPFDTAYAATDYLYLNTCGALDFYTDSDWCPLRGTLVFKTESRDQNGPLQATARKRMNRTLSKFAAYYNVNGSFPVQAAPMTLAALAGAPVAAATCTGTYTWNGIPLACDDFFSPWGTPVTYTLVSGNLIVLSVSTPLTDSAGNTVTVAAELGT